MTTQLRDMVIESVVKAAVPKLIAMFIPGAGMIDAVLNIYNTIAFFIEKAEEIADLVEGVFDSISNFAAGQVGPAANRIERIMGSGLSLMISFLAKFLRLNNLADRIKTAIGKLQEKIDKALDKFVEKIAEKAKNFANRNQPAGSQQQSNQPAGSQTQAPPSPTPSPTTPPRPQNASSPAPSPAGSQTPAPQQNQQNQAPNARNQIGDGEVGKVVSFRAGGENHRLWVEVTGNTAKIMVASNQDEVVNKIREWQGRINELQGENRKKAERLLSRASQQLGITQTQGQQAVQELREAQNASNPQHRTRESNEFIQADNQTEAAEDILANTLKGLFDIFTSEPQAVAGSGFIDYGTLDGKGRPQGILARLTEIKTGSHAESAIHPPGFIPNQPGKPVVFARGHLLGRQLGGSGKERKNLVTLYQTPVNTPNMLKLENQVKKAVKDGETVLYRVTPIYNGDEPKPIAIQITAQGNKGFSINDKIDNKK